MFLLSFFKDKCQTKLVTNLGRRKDFVRNLVNLQTNGWFFFSSPSSSRGQFFLISLLCIKIQSNSFFTISGGVSFLSLFQISVPNQFRNKLFIRDIQLCLHSTLHVKSFAFACQTNNTQQITILHYSS